MKLYSSLVLSMVLLAGCGSKPTTRQVASTEPHRYIAWLEGDMQTDYKADRDLASSRLSELLKDPPSEKDEEKYLEYLSLLDAAGRSNEAGEKLKKYLADHPKDARAQFLLACHFWRTKKNDLAMYLFGRLEKENSFVWKSMLYNNLGMVALQDKDRRLAIEYFQKATKEKPPIAAPYVNLGALYLQSLSYEQAEKVFYMAYNIDKSFEDALVGWAVSLEGLGKYDEAHKAYENFIEDHPSALSALYNDAILLGNRLNRKADASQRLLNYVQRGGKASAKAQEFIQSWR